MSLPSSKSAFHYKHYASFLAAYIGTRKRKTPAYSYQALSRAAGLRSQSLVAMVASGKRLPTRSTLRKLNAAMKASAAEGEYLETLVDFLKTKDADEREVLNRKLKELCLEFEPLAVEVDEFAVISDWWHVAILETLCLADFREEPAWIAARLGGRVEVATVREALARLERVGLVRRDAAGRLMQGAPEFVTRDATKNAAVRKYHEQMAALGVAAFAGAAAVQRTVSGSTLAVEALRVPEAIKALEEFRRRFIKQFGSERGDEIFQLNLHFFALSGKGETH